MAGENHGVKEKPMLGVLLKRGGGKELRAEVDGSKRNEV